MNPANRNSLTQITFVALSTMLNLHSYADTGHRVRFATFNVAMNRPQAGALAEELESGESDQVERIAEIIQRVRPDVLLLNEVDFDKDQRAISVFLERFLGVGQGDQQPIQYPHVFTDAVNTGALSGRDLDKDGKVDGYGDRLGFARFPGQYGMAVLSKYPINKRRIRTFKNFRWQQMPDAMLPQLQGKSFYDQGDLAVLPLSSKSHWDVPVSLPDGVVHFLVCHPTPPVFDGDEDRNGTRNHDEIRLFADYVDANRSGYIVDDQGQQGGLQAGERFVIAGDLNADPVDGQSTEHAIRQLTQHPLIQSAPIPKSDGAVEAAKSQGQANDAHQGDPAYDTGDFNDKSVGNLRIDYVLPSVGLVVHDCGVFWPSEGQPGSGLTSASDHRMVWVDLSIGGEQP